MMMMGVVGASGVKEIISDYTETCILMPFSSISSCKPQNMDLK